MNTQDSAIFTNSYIEEDIKVLVERWKSYINKANSLKGNNRTTVLEKISNIVSLKKILKDTSNKAAEAAGVFLETALEKEILVSEGTKIKIKDFLTDISNNVDSGTFDEMLNKLASRIIKKNTDKSRKWVGEGDIVDFYKLQSLGEVLEYQKHVCPGGFDIQKIGFDDDSKEYNFNNHVQHLNEILDSFYENSKCDVIFSNEALDLKTRLNESTEWNHELVDMSPLKENYSFSYKNDTENVEQYVFNFDGNFYLVVVKGDKYYLTSHFSSIKEFDREDKSKKFCENLDEFITGLKKKANEYSENKKFGGFAGDINLYLVKDGVNGEFVLREGVENALRNHDLFLTIAPYKLNKQIRADIQDQWHKIETGEKPNPKLSYDSLIVLEPEPEQLPRAPQDTVPTASEPEPIPEPEPEPKTYLDKLVHFKKLKGAKVYSQFVNWLSRTNMLVFAKYNQYQLQKSKLVAEPFKPFVYDKQQNEGCITDHIAVSGYKLAVYSGADGDGIGNGAKKFTQGLPEYVKELNDSQFKLHVATYNTLLYLFFDSFLTIIGNHVLTNDSSNKQLQGGNYKSKKHRRLIKHRKRTLNKKSRRGKKNRRGRKTKRK